MAPSPMFVATTQAVSLSAASNVAAQVIEMYRSQVSTSNNEANYVP